MTSQPGKQTIAIHILPYISKSKGYWTMIFGHIVEYNIRNVSWKNHTHKRVEKLFSGPFLKNQNDHISGLVV